jgi:hypothetical protein
MAATTPLEEQLVAACRTGFGDSLRSVILFTPDEWELLYMRKDLEQVGDAIRGVKERLVQNERLGFTSQETYRELSQRGDIEPALGEYLLTIRAFERGYLGRTIVGDRGVIVTTDEMNIDAFEDIKHTVRKLLTA